MGFYLPTFGQKVIVSLSSQGEEISEKRYDIEEVIDLRIKKGKIGDVHDINGKLQVVELKEGLDDEARQFFKRRVNPLGQNVQKIQVRIFELNLVEKAGLKNKVYEGDVQLVIGFFKKGEFEPLHLVDFTGSIQYRRSPNRMDMIPEVVNKIFLNASEYFDTWMNMQVMNNPNLATEVQLEIIDRVKASHRDTVYYDPNRPLVWGDFADQPRGKSKFNASIFTSFAIQGKTTVEAGKIIQILEIDIYMLPDQSWVKSPSDYSLNHEQRHFDVVRVVVDRFIDRLQNLRLDPDWYEATINDAFFDAYREMNRLQEIYDKETSHGMDVQAQDRWNRMLDEALAGNWNEIDRTLSK